MGSIYRRFETAGRFALAQPQCSAPRSGRRQVCNRRFQSGRFEIRLTRSIQLSLSWPVSARHKACPCELPYQATKRLRAAPARRAAAHWPLSSGSIRFVNVTKAFSVRPFSTKREAVRDSFSFSIPIGQRTVESPCVMQRTPGLSAQPRRTQHLLHYLTNCHCSSDHPIQKTRLQLLQSYREPHTKMFTRWVLDCIKITEYCFFGTTASP